MNIKLKNPEMWLEFDFPTGCLFDESGKDFLRRSAAGSREGGCCPCYFCFSLKQGHPCDSKVAEECARRCEKHYENISRGERSSRFE